MKRARHALYLFSFISLVTLGSALGQSVISPTKGSAGVAGATGAGLAPDGGYNGALTVFGGLSTSGDLLPTNSGTQHIGGNASNGWIDIYIDQVRDRSGNTHFYFAPGYNGLISYLSDSSSTVSMMVGNSTTLTSVGAKVLQLCADNPLTCASEVLSVDKDGAVLHKGNPTLRTCTAALEGLVSRDVLSGIATGKRTKLCLCTSDGSSVYKWQNMVTGTLGSTTVCGTE